MKNKPIVLLLGLLLGGVNVATSQNADLATDKKTDAPPTAAAAQTADAAPAAPASKSEPAAAASTKPAADGTLRLNFRGVPLDQVLEYLSEAAGFIIVKEADVKGKVDAWSNQPLTKDEAVELLNTVLNKNDYAAIRNGRTLTIVSRETAKKRNIPVKRGGEATSIPANDEMVTQIVPVRHANVTQLTANLQPLMASDSPGTMTANESANTLIITATQAEIRHITEIINALDDSISGTSTIHVFPLRYADAKELANTVKELFAPAATTTGGNNRNQFGGGGGGFGGGGFGGGAFGGGGGNAGGGGGRGGNAGGAGSAATSAANSRVVAVADERSNSLVVGAPDDLFATIKDMVTQIDQPVSDITELRVFHLVNADPLEMVDLFTSLFPDDSKTDANQSQQGFRFNRGGFGGGPFGGGAAATTATDSSRMKKKGRVTAVADQRTSSIIVSAASELMPQISEMVAQLDSSPAKRQHVYVYSLENADVQQVQQILQDMFQKNNTQSRSSSQTTSPLTTRSQTTTSTIGTSSSSSGFGNSGSGNSSGFGTTGR